MKRMALAILLSTTPLACEAAEWETVFSYEKESAMIDKESIAPYSISDSVYLQVWVRFEKSKAELFPNTKKKFNSMDSLMILNCESKEAAQRSIIYRYNGSVVYSASQPPILLEFKPVSPESVGEIILNRACALKPGA